MGWERAQLNKTKRRWYECMYWFYVKFVSKSVYVACMQKMHWLNVQKWFPRNSKILPETTLTQRWKKVGRDFRTLRLCDVVTTLVLRCHNVTTTSLNKVATTLSSIVGGTFISNDLTMLRLTFYVSRERNMQRVEKYIGMFWDIVRE